VAAFAFEEIAGVASDYECASAYGTWTFHTDGTDWFIQ
jgi:hypothetical protein